MRCPARRNRVLRHRRFRPADGRRSRVPGVQRHYGLVGKNAQGALRGGCPIVASFGGGDRFLRTVPQRPEWALDALGIDHFFDAHLKT